MTVHKIILQFLVGIVSFFILPFICSAWPGKVISVADGDTIAVLHDGKEEKIRLHGIDCPEGDQAFGDKAKAITTSMVNGRAVNVVSVTTDKYGRTVGLITVDGQSLNESIIRNGYAWVFTKYCKESFCQQWQKIEEAARMQRKGMWADPQIIPPWEWRQLKKEKAAEDEKRVREHDRPSAPLPAAGSVSSSQYRCDGRTRCTQMTSCEEAKFFLQNCPGAKMDGNHDGVPCERQWCH